MEGLAWLSMMKRRSNAYAKGVSSENIVREVLGGRNGERFTLNSPMQKNFLLLSLLSAVRSVTEYF